MVGLDIFALRRRDIKKRKMLYLPNSGADVVVKVILDKTTHNAGFPNPRVLEENEGTSMKFLGLAKSSLCTVLANLCKSRISMPIRKNSVKKVTG